MIGEPEKDINSFLLEMAWFNLEDTIKRKENIENKANFILVASGVLLGIQFFSLGKMPVIYSTIISMGFIITAILAAFVIRVEIYPLMGVMNTWRALKEDKILDKTKEAQRRILASLDEIITSNIKIINRTACYYKFTQISFIISLLLLLGGIIAFAISSPI